MVTKLVEPEPMNGTDATLWDIERDPALRTTVVAVLTLDRRISFDLLVRNLDIASRLVPRLRQRVVEAPLGAGPPHWVLVDTFQVADHVRRHDVAGGEHSFADVLAVATECATVPFDRDQPLWECVYVDRVDGHGAALVLKVHHALTDGVGGMGILDAVLDVGREPEERAPDSIPDLVGPPASEASSIERIDRAVEGAVDRSTRLQRSATRLTLDALRDPLRSVSSVMEGGRSAARLLSPSGSALSPLFTDRGEGRWLGCHELELERIHAAAGRHGCTLNHLFLSGVVGGAAQYHADRGAAIQQLRLSMPISVRKPGDPAGGNQWAPVRFRLPTDITDPVARMLAVRTITGRARGEKALGFSHSMAGAIQRLPSLVSSSVVGGMMKGVDGVCTNVPGLAEPRYVAGARVERMYAFAPAGGAAFNVALLSHEATACFGTLIDTAAVAAPVALHEAIVAGLEGAVAAAETRPPQRAVAVERDRAPERLTALDTTFLRLESPSLPMHIGGVFRLDGGPLRDDDGHLRLDDIRAHVEARLARTPRFLRRLQEVPLGQGRPLWVDDPDFDIVHHVKTTTVDAPGGDEELFARASELNMEVLDRSRPLWELWFVEGLADDSVGLVKKVHHSLLDGVSAVEFIASLFDVEPIPEGEVPIRTPVPPPPSGVDLVADAWVERLRDPAVLARDATAAVRSTPSQVASQVRDVLAAAKEALVPSDKAPPTVLNRHVGAHRRLTSVDVPLDEVSAVRSHLGGSPNDVALAIITGGLRAWFAEHHEPLEELHAMCPVSVRPAGTADGGNHVGTMMIPLPLAEPDPARRLAIITERTSRAKQRHDGEALATALDALDHIPPMVPGVVGAALRSFAANQESVNLTITNVPGPRVPLWFLGAEATGIVPVVPLGPNTALGVALLSYVDHLTIGLHVDPDVCRDIDVLAGALRAAVDELLVAARAD